MYYVKGYCTFFFIRIFFYWVFSSKILTRHIIMNIQGRLLRIVNLVDIHP